MRNQASGILLLAIVSMLAATSAAAAGEVIVENHLSRVTDSSLSAHTPSMRPGEPRVRGFNANAESVIASRSSTAKYPRFRTPFVSRGRHVATSGMEGLHRESTSYPSVRRLPPIPRELLPNSQMGLANSESEKALDGTWREDDQSITINLNGQELTLRKTGPTRAVVTSKNAPPPGEVFGRLSHGGLPLVDCTVALIRLKKTWGDYEVDRSVEPLWVKTSDNGVYHFADVAAGPYKLSWLPAGQRQWIRRIEFRPDVRVKNDETTWAKQIRVSLRTIN